MLHVPPVVAFVKVVVAASHTVVVPPIAGTEGTSITATAVETELLPQLFEIV